MTAVNYILKQVPGKEVRKTNTGKPHWGGAAKASEVQLENQLWFVKTGETWSLLHYVLVVSNSK